MESKWNPKVNPEKKGMLGNPEYCSCWMLITDLNASGRQRFPNLFWQNMCLRGPVAALGGIVIETIHGVSQNEIQME